MKRQQICLTCYKYYIPSFVLCRQHIFIYIATLDWVLLSAKSMYVGRVNKSKVCSPNSRLIGSSRKVSRMEKFAN